MLGLGETLQSMFVNFRKFDNKKIIIKKAWQKWIKVDSKPVFFDHDCGTEVVQKRKAYAEIKTVQKEKGIKFQTPLTRIKIHWSDNP